MFHRLLNLPEDRSCFLFGARGTGKSTLLRATLPPAETRTFDLLEADLEDRFARDPQAFTREVLALPSGCRCVVVDEIQKVPRLLDAVHDLLENHRVPQRFIMTGSSARKLKQGGANLLAGRAFLRHLYPLTRRELGPAYDLERHLAFGGLPEVWNLGNDEARADYLRAYVHGYLREEVRAEQLVRRIDSFRRFLEVAAQGSGKILNYARIARDVGSDPKSVAAWYLLLEDTLLGFHVDAYSGSVRKQLRQAPKFYLFDLGAARATAHMLKVQPHPGSSYYGECFEHLVLQELQVRNAYEALDWRFSYLQTKSGLKVDLVIQRPGRPPALVEIKSGERMREEDAAVLRSFEPVFPESDLLLLSRDPRAQHFGPVRALHWEEGVLAV